VDTRKRLQVLFDEGTLSGVTDGVLLDRLATPGDRSAAAAFAALVERHGPMVLRVCKQVLEDPHDAEDAFQATFLVFFRRARSIRNRGSLASWLFGVAHRVACRARKQALRRRGHERRYAERVAGESRGRESRSENWPEFHDDVASLPDKLRSPVVLCYLEGLTAEAAALKLGCPRGTVLSRLSTARERLRDRLSRRGVGLPAGLLTAGLTAAATEAAFPATLGDSLVRSVLSIATDKTSAGAVSPAAAALTHGVLNMMCCARLIRVAAAVAAVGLVVPGTGLVVRRPAQAARQDVPSSGAAKSSSPASKPAPLVGKDAKAVEARKGGTGEIIVRAADMSGSPERREEAFMGIAAIDPETGKWRTIYKGLSDGPISPDGRYMVYSIRGLNLDKSQIGVWVHDLKSQTQGRRIFLRRGFPLWSHNGQKVVISVPLDNQPRKFETWRVNVNGTDQTKLPVPETDFVVDCSRDGNWLAAWSQGGDPNHRGRLTLIHPDGTGARWLTEGSAKSGVSSASFKISPDGRSVAYAEMTTEGNASNARLYVVNTEGRQRREIPIKFEPDTLVTMHWSPDGARLALALMNPQTREASLALVNLDGSNYRNLSLPPGKWNLLVCDWQALTPGLRVPQPGALEESPETKRADSPRSRYRAVLEEYERAMNVFFEAREQAKSANERNQIAREKYPQPRTFVRRFLEVADSAPDDPAAADALVWVLEHSFDGPDLAHAIDLLATHHAANRMVGHAAMTLRYTTSPATEKLFHAIIDQSTYADIKGLACLSLGRYYKNLSEKVRSIKEDPDEAREWRAMMIEQGAAGEDFDRLVGRDPDALMQQADEALERAVNVYGDTSGQSGSLAADARKELFEIRELAIGKPAPDMAGEDVDGQPMKLSDFRGKVVCLIFWSNACTPCREIVKYEQPLAKALRSEPLSLLGVNLGDDRDLLKRQIKESGITFRSWWDAGGNLNATGPIASRFNISGLPTLYVLDSRGIIRHKFFGSVSNSRLSSVIDPLVKAEKEDLPASR